MLRALITPASTPRTATPVVITEREVMLSTAVAAAAPRRVRSHWGAATVVAVVHRLHIHLPEPRPHCARLEASYFEVARMSRELDHL